MSRRGVVAAAFVLLLAVAALPGPAGAANECNGIPRCLPVEGPWVAVPANGEVVYGLACPQRKGIIAGTDALATSIDVRASFDGILGSPVAFGRTTNTAALFRAVSAHHRAGAFKPFIGCVPRLRLSVTRPPRAPPGRPSARSAVRVLPVKPGFQRVVMLSCPAGETLVDSWNATAFTTAKPPAPGLAGAIRVQSHPVGARVQMSISVSEALRPGADAQVQLGVRCAA